METSKNEHGYEYSRRQRNKKDLGRLLGVSRYILDKMLEDSKQELGEPIGKSTYSIHQVDFLVAKYGIMPKKNATQ
jgi:hypothetical protein